MLRRDMRERMTASRAAGLNLQAHVAQHGCGVASSSSSASSGELSDPFVRGHRHHLPSDERRHRAGGAEFPLGRRLEVRRIKISDDQRGIAGATVLTTTTMDATSEIETKAARPNAPQATS
jgi:hypothetical protein